MTKTAALDRYSSGLTNRLRRCVRQSINDQLCLAIQARLIMRDTIHIALCQTL